MTNDALLQATGLSEAEALIRLQTEGYNELPSARPRSLFVIARDVLREPMFLLLVACATVYVFLGSLEEALMLVVAVFVIMGITFYQERKTERTLEALRDLSSPRARVIREGEQKRIAGREVVTGDILVLSEGDRVPADALLLSCQNIAADESLLTGESVAVRKTAASQDAEMQRPGGEDLPFVYSGTLVVQGHGLARVKATGERTEIGRIGKSLQAVEQEKTRLQQSTNRLVRNFAIIGMSLCVLAALGYGLTRGNWLNGLLTGLTMAISMVPEEFPVILTIFLALGAWRIAQKNVLTRRVPAIETLGAATVLCVDKTGTLTQNRMSVCKLGIGGDILDVSEGTPQTLPDAYAELVTIAILASQPDPFDPMEKAIHQLGAQMLPAAGESRSDWLLVRQYALSPQLPAMSHAWKAPEHPYHIVAAKGAPEAIATLCHFDAARLDALHEEVKALAAQGLRVLAVARRIHEEDGLPEGQHEFAFTFLGMIGLADPVRPMVAAAMKECYSAGIRVIMITGDYPETACSIARQIGLEQLGGVITGQEVLGMNEEELQQRVGAVNIFARVMPEQKLRLVNALKARGEVVAMTGDGVNDAPALKAAHIGIAMGGRGTDVAREAAALVLLDDDFSSIVQAIRLGRRIYSNIKNAMSYALAIHIPIGGLSLLPVLFGWPLILLPIHIVFLELIIDPACSTVFEAEPENPKIMQRPPHDPHEPLFSRSMIGLSLLQGVGVLLIVLAVYSLSYYLGEGALDARTLTFTTLVLANLGLILTNLSWSRTILQTLRLPNKVLWVVLGGVVAALTLALSVPALRGLFHFSVLHVNDLVLCFGASVFSILWFEAFKAFRSHHRFKQDLYKVSNPLS